MRKVQFLKDFATKKKDDYMEVGDMLASRLSRRKIVKSLKKRGRKANEPD